MLNFTFFLPLLSAVLALNQWHSLNIPGSLLIKSEFSWIDYSDWITGCMSEEPWLYSRLEEEIFLFTKASIPVLGHTQHPTDIPVCAFHRGDPKWARSWQHLYLPPHWRQRGEACPLPTCLHSVHMDCCTFTLLWSRIKSSRCAENYRPSRKTEGGANVCHVSHLLPFHQWRTHDTVNSSTAFNHIRQCQHLTAVLT